MGEYAVRKSDRAEIKIGTCESMYYLRYDDRGKVSKQQGSLDAATTHDLFWRLPFPDEDSVKIGEYAEHDRGLRLWKQEEGQQYAEAFQDESTTTNPGTIQLTHESGLLVNVNCYHGVKLPEGGKDVKMCWNGKSWSFELAFIKNTKDGIKPIVKCRHCRSMWRYEWQEVLPFVNGEIKARLEKYAEDC